MLVGNELFLHGLLVLLLGRLPTFPTMTRVNTVKLPQVLLQAYCEIGDIGPQKVVIDDPGLLWGFHCTAVDCKRVAKALVVCSRWLVLRYH